MQLGVSEGPAALVARLWWVIGKPLNYLRIAGADRSF